MLIHGCHCYFAKKHEMNNLFESSLLNFETYKDNVEHGKGTYVGGFLTKL